MDIAGHSFLFMAVAAFAVFFVGVAKAGFGGMIGSLAMPLVAAFSDIGTAIAVLLPTYFVMDVIVAYIYRKSVPWDFMWPMAAAGVAGVVLGAFAFRIVDPPLLAVLLGVMSLFVGLRFFWQRRREHITLATSQGPSDRNWPRLIGLNGASGFTSFFLMGEAPIQVFMFRFRLAPQIYVAVLVWFFFIVNAIKIPIVLGMGIVTVDSLWVSALLLPVMPFGILVGKLINDRLPKEPFYKIVHILLIGLGVYLIGAANA
jgi:uncharacterized membrane protein YfcA